MSNAINLNLRPSRYFFTLISGLYIVMLFITCMLDFKAIIFGFILLNILVSYCFLIKKYIYRTNKYSILQINQDPNSCNPMDWQVTFLNHKQSAYLQTKGYISDYLIILNFKIQRKLPILLKYFNNKTISALIFLDMVDYKDYCKLRKFLQGY